MDSFFLNSDDAECSAEAGVFCNVSLCSRCQHLERSGWCWCIGWIRQVQGCLRCMEIGLNIAKTSTQAGKGTGNSVIRQFHYSQQKKSTRTLFWDDVLIFRFVKIYLSLWTKQPNTLVQRWCRVVPSSSCCPAHVMNIKDRLSRLAVVLCCLGGYSESVIVLLYDYRLTQGTESSCVISGLTTLIVDTWNGIKTL